MKALLLIPLLAVLASCSSKEKAPRNAEVIFQEQQELDGLYFTRSGKRVNAPLQNGIFLDGESGEICFPALACGNPDCPKGTEDKPYLFFADDPSVILSGDGTLGMDMNAEITSEDPATEAMLAGHCPACLESRNLTRESREDWDNYARFVHPYMQPETRAKMRRLDAERKRSKSASRRE
jgi:hypothetical protein